MENKKYKAAVIGCGKIGAEEDLYKKAVKPGTHAMAYKSNLKIELSALVDTNMAKLQKAGKFFPGASLFSNAKEMLEKIRPEIVSIATPPDSHFELVRLAASHNAKAVICEKPIAKTLEEANEMIKICKKNNVLLFVNHQRRFDYIIRKWQGRIKKGLLGEIRQGSCFYYNGLFNGGTHMIDMLLFFLGEVDFVSAVKNEKTSWKESDIDADCQIHFKNGAVVSMQSLPKNYGFFELYFYGEKGFLALKKLGYEIEYRKLVKNKYYKGYNMLSGTVEKEGSERSFMSSVIKHVVSCLEGKEKPIGTGEDGLAVLKVLFSLKESAIRNGKIITI